MGPVTGSYRLPGDAHARPLTLSNAKAPVLAHFSSAASGLGRSSFPSQGVSFDTVTLVTLRAYNAQDAYRAELQKRLDHYVKIARMNYDLNRWINVRIDVLGALFTASLAAYLTYGGKISAADVGFSLNRAAEFTNMVLLVVRIYNQFQVQLNRWAYHRHGRSLILWLTRG